MLARRSFFAALGTVLAAQLASAGAASAFLVDVEAAASGFIKPFGNSGFELGTTIMNYQAGYNATTDETTKNWFVFDVPVLSPGDSIVGAVLSLYLPSFGAGDAGDGYDAFVGPSMPGVFSPSEIFTLFSLDPSDYSIIDPDTIIGDDATGADFDAWYPVLGAGGEIMGDVEVTKSDEGTSVDLIFTPEGLAELEANVGSTVLFGGLLTSIDNLPALDVPEGIFHHTHPEGVAGPATPSGWV